MSYAALRSDPALARHSILLSASCSTHRLLQQAYLSGQPWPLSGFVGNMMLQPYWCGMQALGASSVPASLPTSALMHQRHQNAFWLHSVQDSLQSSSLRRPCMSHPVCTGCITAQPLARACRRL